MAGDGPETAAETTLGTDTARVVRDMGALLALPAMWVDQRPGEVVSGLLGVLVGILGLESAYARFEDADGGATLESWRPAGPDVPAELQRVEVDGELGIERGGIEVAVGGHTLRVTTLRLALPWGTGRVAVSCTRAGFPTALEHHLLRVAVGQAAIAIHTARVLEAEHAARTAAEDALARQRAILRTLFDDIEPSLSAITRQMRDLAASVSEPADPGGFAGGSSARSVASDAVAGDHHAALSHREAEVLGLLAQGLSNKEIAGVLWLSVRTVERHITSLYRKIGVGRRSEATAFALRHSVR